MGVKVFRGNNWERIKSGVISRRDLMGLDPDLDRELIRFLLFHAPFRIRRPLLRYAAERYGVDGRPEPLINTDDPEDRSFWEYAVLREQIERENDRDILEAAMRSDDRDLAWFAYCRLTGSSLEPDKCDAYSYRTYSCGILPGMTEEEDVRRIR